MSEINKAMDIGNKYRTHFDWPDVSQVWDKLLEEISELKECLHSPENRPHQLHELGDVFLTFIQVARHLKLDPEMALKLANQRFENRFSMMAQLIKKDNKVLSNLELMELDSYWQKAKQHTKSTEEKALTQALAPASNTPATS